MLLFELFNTVYPAGVTADNDELFRMAFFDNKALVPVVFKAVKVEDDQNVWAISFTRGREIEITKQGNAYKIFATIIECIRTFVSKKHPDAILFEAYEPSRQSLYKNMILKLAPTIGYRQATELDNDYLVSLGGEYLSGPSYFILIKQ